jgi:hypothetical protein
MIFKLDVPMGLGPEGDKRSEPRFPRVFPYGIGHTLKGAAKERGRTWPLVLNRSFLFRDPVVFFVLALFVISHSEGRGRSVAVWLLSPLQGLGNGPLPVVLALPLGSVEFA